MVICLEQGANDLHGPADGTATQSSLASIKSRIAYLSGASLPRLSWKTSSNFFKEIKTSTYEACNEQ